MQGFNDDAQRRRDIEEATLKDLRLSNINKFISAMNQLRPAWVNDPLCAHTEELLKTIMHSDAPLPISAVANDMGITLHHDQLMKAGAIVARLYREKHRTEPPKRHNGDDRRVNAYTMADRELIMAALAQLE